jgi:hypothetical protein
MKLGAIVSAVNSNPHYMSFVPLFIRAWTALFPELQVIVVLVANEIPTEFLEYRNHIRLAPVDPSISSVLAAQCIRLLWPRFVETEDAVLITDIDMIPLQRDYYVNPIKDVSNDTFVVYRHGLPIQLYMCYVAGTPSTWRKMFGEESYQTILKRWYSDVDVSDIQHNQCVPGCKSWYKDQIELTKAFNALSGPKKLYTDDETGFRRFCRSFLHHPVGSWTLHLIENRTLIRTLIRKGYFSDYHAISNTTHRDLNEFIINCLSESYIA